MKKAKLWLVILLSLGGIALGIGIFFGSRQQGGPITSPALSTSNAANPIPAQTLGHAPKRKNAWARPQTLRVDNPADRERWLRNENIRLDIASQANENLFNTMGLGEDEESRLRQSFANYRTGMLRMIENPSEFAGAAQDDGDPSLPWNVYERQLKEILGLQRYQEFEVSYKKEQFVLAKQRQAPWKAAIARSLTQKPTE